MTIAVSPPRSASSRTGTRHAKAAPCNNDLLRHAAASTALTMSARPPTRPAAVTQRSRAGFNRPVPIPRPLHATSAASCPRSRQGTGSGGCPVGWTVAPRSERRPLVRGHSSQYATRLVDNKDSGETLLLIGEGAGLAPVVECWLSAGKLGNLMGRDQWFRSLREPRISSSR